MCMYWFSIFVLLYRKRDLQAGFKYKGTLVRPARVQVYSSEGHA